MHVTLLADTWTVNCSGLGKWHLTLLAFFFGVMVGQIAVSRSHLQVMCGDVDAQINSVDCMNCSISINSSHGNLPFSCQMFV